MKRRRISARAVLFDWDGTLLDSFRADTRAYRAMFRALEINFSDRELARHYSPDWYRVYRAARIPRKQWDLADRLWAAAYRKENPRLLPEANAVLKKLSHSFALGSSPAETGSAWSGSSGNSDFIVFFRRVFVPRTHLIENRTPRHSMRRCVICG